MKHATLAGLENVLAAALVAVTATAPFSMSAWAGPTAAPAPSTPLEASQFVRLPGSVHRLAQPRFDIGEAPSSLRMGSLEIVFAKTPAQEAALKQLLDAQQDPKSSLYHHFLTPAEYGARFGASDRTIAAVSQWLEANGFRVRPIAANRAQLYFSGNKAQVEAAFQTQIHLFEVQGERHFANVSDPQIPADLAPVIAGIRGLHDFYMKSTVRKQRLLKRPLPETTYDGAKTNYVGPNDFATIYNLLPLYNAGITGRGVTIAIGGESDINPAIADAYWMGFGITAPPLQSVPVPGGQDPGLTHDGKEDEAYVDVEIAGGLARGATILLVRDKNVLNAAEYAIQQNLAPILSLSFGACEANLNNAPLDSLFAEAASQGITVTVSSGDQGVAGCFGNDFTQGDLSTSGYAVNGNASSPHVLAVGGTEFDPTMTQDWAATNASGTLTSALAHIPEMVWNSTCADPEGAQYFGFADPTTFCNTATLQGQPNPYIQVATASGGVSSCTTVNQSGACTGGYAQPSWQQGVNGIQNFGARAVPDVALLAHSWLGCSYNSAACDPTTGNEVSVFEGTSVAAPAMAAIVALLDQALITNASPDGRQGLVTPTLYRLAASEYGTPQAPNSAASACSASLGNTIGAGCVFYDVTAGSNATGCQVAAYKSTGSLPASTCAAPSGDANGIMQVNGSPDYPATTGFDLASGLGSINAANLVFAVALPAPSGLSAAPGGQSVALTWTADPQAASFDVYQGTKAGQEGTTPVQTGVTGTTATVQGLQFGQSYVFTIAAVAALGTSAQSNEAQATTLPAAPASLTAAAGNGTVSLTWSTAAGAASYNVYQGTAAGGEAATPVASGLTTTSNTVSGLTNGTTYFFTVAAVDAGGTSGKSNEASATPAAPSHGGGGGGMMGLFELALLGALCLLRARPVKILHVATRFTSTLSH